MRVWFADHRAVDHLFATENHFLNFGGCNVLTAADNQLLEPSGDREISVGVRFREITRIIPAIAERRLSLGRLVVVAAHQVRPPNDQFALRAGHRILTGRWINYANT